MPFFLSIPFKTRKLVVYCSTYVSYGCTEGRQLLVIIAAYINEGRYSNSPTYNSELSEALIEHVLNLPVFVPLIFIKSNLLKLLLEVKRIFE